METGNGSEQLRAKFTLMPELPQDQKRYQRVYYDGPTRKHMVPVDSPYLRRHIAEALKDAEVTAGDRILEIGCGMGRYTLLLASQKLAVEAIDMSPVMLQRLEKFNSSSSRVTLHCGDIESLGEEFEGRFDAVLGFFVLHHLADLPRSFAAVLRALRRGGRAVFVEPNPFNPLYYAQIAITPGITWKGDRGILNMRRGIVLEAMREAGLRDPGLRRFGFFPPQIANLTWTGPFERRIEAITLLEPVLPFQVFRATRP